MRWPLTLLVVAGGALLIGCEDDETNNVTVPDGGGLGAIFGRVHTVDDKPIADATIVTDPVTETVQSDAKGFFRYNDLRVAAYFVSISKAGYITERYPVAVEDGQVFPLFATLRSASPDTVAIVATLSTGGGTVGIAARGTTVFAAGESGLQIFDLSDPTDPILLGQVAIPSSYNGDVELIDNVAFVTSAGSSLVVVDVSNLSAPMLASPVELGGLVRDVEVDGDLLICAADDSVVVLDAANPLSPSRIGAVATRQDGLGQGNFGAGLDVTRDLAIISAFNNGIDIVDYSNPTTPEVVGHLGSSINPWDAFVDSVTEQAFIAGSDGLQIISYTSPNFPQVLGHWSPAGSSRDVVVVGSLALNATDFNGLQVADVSDPTHIRSRQNISAVHAGRPQNIALDNRRAYVAADDRLLVVDFPEASP